ncbi:MAG: radical SAM protein [Petrotogales bacterium]
MVILATGLCPSKCFYCPLSFKKGGKDRIFADEWELESEEDINKLINEANYINASGAGITGGDPLIVWKRVKRYISLLKDVFGEKFHIHLYTSGLKDAENLSKLVSAGLDEIRFHPPLKYWSNMENSPIKNSIKNALDTSADVALEIPAIPNMERRMTSLIKWANDKELRWVNLNELEYSERNCELLNNRNYMVKDEISAAVKGSQESATTVLEIVKNENLDIGVHYCSVSFKDGIQLKNRIKRRAHNIAKEYEVISEEGTIIKGAIYKLDISIDQLYVSIKEEYDIPEELIFLDREKNRIEIGLWILEKIASDLKKNGYECFMVEEYPTADRLEVEKIPIPF